MRHLSGKLVAGLVALCAATGALGQSAMPAQSAQAWPSRAITIIGGFPNGAGTDLYARKLGEALTAALRRVTLKQGTDAVVVMIGSAFKNKAVQPLMDAVVKLLPSPLDRPPVQANVVAPASKQRAAGKADAAIVLRRSCRLS